MKVVMQSVFLLSVFLVAGCAGEPDLTDPEVVLEEFLDAVFVERDRELAAGFVIEGEREDFLESFDDILENEKEDPMPEDPGISIEVDGDSARASFENWDAAGGLNLERVDGVWWIAG